MPIMAIDASIYGNVGKVPSVADYDRQALDLENARTQGNINALGLLTGQQKFQEGQRQLQRGEALRQLAGGWGPDTSEEQRISDLKRGGFFNEADTLAKTALERGKAGAENRLKNAQADEALLKQTDTKLGQQQKYWELVANRQQAAALLTSAWNDPHLGPIVRMRGGTLEEHLAAIPQDPGQFQNYVLGQAKGIGEVRKITTPDANAVLASQTQIGTNSATNARIAAENAASRAQAERHFGITEARQRETQAANLSKPFEVTGPEGTPILVQQDKQGNITPVTGYAPKGGALKPLNDTQSKALGFGTRMQEANRLLSGLSGQYSPASVNAKMVAENVPLIGGAIGPAANALLSEQGQQAEQAQRDFVNAVLRRESGAAVSASEFDNARKQYFPQPNDKPGTLAQKERNRRLAIEGVLSEVPKAYKNSIGLPETAPAKQSVQSGTDLGGGFKVK